MNFSAYLDVRPNDDIVDILGFLSFEMVRSLCVTALEVRQRLERTAPTPPVPPTPTRRPTNANANLNTGKVSPVKRRWTQDSPLKKAKSDIVASPEAITPATATTMDHRKHVTTGAASGPHHPVSLFAPPPSARSPLLPSHVLEAFAQIQRQQGSTRIGGMRNFRGGINRCRVALV